MTTKSISISEKFLLHFIFLFVLVMGAGNAFGNDSNVPNLYEMAANNIQISYSTYSLSGEPRLNYSNGRKHLTFTGDEIRVARSEIGQLVTVTINNIPDLKTVTATVLIPKINLDREAVPFKTVLLFTTHKTTIAGQDMIKGQVQVYHSIPLEGKASHVNFIRSNLSGEVTMSPTCPGAQRTGQICEEPFVGASVQVLGLHGNVVASTVTNEKGLFDTLVPPGKYDVKIERYSVVPPPRPNPMPTPMQPNLGSVDMAQNVTADISDLSLFPICPDTLVAVPDQGSVFISIKCDTGIR